MIDRWQIALVAAVLTIAWFVDVQLFALLAGLSVAALVFARVHGRARARLLATAPLEARVRAVVGLSPEAELTVRRGGRPLRLAVTAEPSAHGPLLGCLNLRAPVVGRVPFCFVAQRESAPVELPSLVENAAVFDAPVECELHAVEPAPGPAGYRWMSSSPDTLRRLLDGAVAPAVGELAAIPGAALAAFHFDGAGVRALLVPAPAATADWIAPALDAVAAFAAAVEDGLERLAAD